MDSLLKPGDLVRYNNRISGLHGRIYEVVEQTPHVRVGYTLVKSPKTPHFRIDLATVCLEKV